MTKNQILKELKIYLTPYYVTLLGNIMIIKKSIMICNVVTEIIKEYNGTPADEEKVCELISKLLKLHFK